MEKTALSDPKNMDLELKEEEPKLSVHDVYQMLNGTSRNPVETGPGRVGSSGSLRGPV